MLSTLYVTHRFHRHLILLLGYLFILNSWAQSISDKPAFIRVIESPENSEVTALELSIVRYQHATKDLTVDLISALHIADKQYYDTLNQRFTTYDALLFELVTNADVSEFRSPSETQSKSTETINSKPIDSGVPNLDTKEKGSSLSGISRVQIWLKNSLDLDFQLDVIDYSADNFVHADFTPAEFDQSLSDNDESLFTEMFRLWRAGMLQSFLHPEMSNDLSFLQAFFSSNREHRLKQQFARQFAQQFSNSGEFDRIMSGKKGSTLVTARNLKAMRVLQEQINKGATHIGIFYGAAHMPDFHRRLLNDYQLKPVSTQWLEAWNLR